jgi:hypothetical protein
MEPGTSSSSPAASTPAPTAGQPATPDPRDTGTVGAALGNFGQHADELRDYLNYYFTAKIESLKSTLRRGTLFVALVVVAAVAAAGLVVTGFVLVCVGIADGLGNIFHAQWLGYLVTGLLVIGIITGGGWLTVRGIFRSAHARSAARFDALQARQRAKFGRDARQQANRETRAL